MKPVLWVGSTLADIRAFPKDARREAGYELFQVQCGVDPSDWKPMGTVGAGVREIRIHTGREHRVIYIAKFEEGAYALHAFEKKSRATARSDVDLARRRFKEVLRARRAKKPGQA